MSRIAIIRQVWLFMHLGTDTVADKFAHHGKAVFFDPLLHGRGDIAQAVSRPNLLNGLIQRFASHAQQIAELRPNFPDGKRQRRISIITIQLDSEIERNNVPFSQAPRARRYAVDDLLIDGGAQHTRVTAITLEGRPSAMLLSALSSNSFQIESAYARLHGLAQPVQYIPDH